MFLSQKNVYKLLSPEALILAQNAPQTVWQSVSAWTRSGNLQRSPRLPSWIKGMEPPGGRRESKGGWVGREQEKGEGTWAQLRLQIWGIEAGAKVTTLTRFHVSLSCC